VQHMNGALLAGTSRSNSIVDKMNNILLK
jgi:hypothetical protein